MNVLKSLTPLSRKVFLSFAYGKRYTERGVKPSVNALRKRKLVKGKRIVTLTTKGRKVFHAYLQAKSEGLL